MAVLLGFAGPEMTYGRSLAAPGNHGGGAAAGNHGVREYLGGGAAAGNHGVQEDLGGGAASTSAAASRNVGSSRVRGERGLYARSFAIAESFDVSLRLAYPIRITKVYLRRVYHKNG